jgi:nitroreductase
MTGGRHIPLPDYRRYAEDEMRRRAASFFAEIKRRRTVRDFAPDPVPLEVIETAIAAAGLAPSGANQQPWHFAVATDPAVKARIRELAEAEEREFYSRRASDEWLSTLAPLGTDANKPFLEIAPVLIAVFQQSWGIGPGGEKIKHYYAPDSIGIATGFLIAGLHAAGLATLTHTPSPMGFLNEIFGRPPNEKPFVLLVVGYPAPGATVPDIAKKPLDEIMSWR